MAGSEEFDLELISAFIDGRLSGEERQRALRLLQESEAAFEVYSDALRARADLANGQVVSIAEKRDRRRGLPWQTIGSLAAAAVVLIAVVPLVQVRRDRAVMETPSIELVRPLARAPGGARTLVGAWDQRDWSVTRGGSARLTDSTVEFRLGVRTADLQAALGQGDTLRADRLVGEILESLNDVESSDFARVDYSAFRASLARGDSTDELVAGAARAERTLSELFDSVWFDFGRWVGAGELAAGARSQAFFADARTERFLRLAARGELLERDGDLLREIAVLAKQGVTDREFETIRQHFRTLIKRRGG